MSTVATNLPRMTIPRGISSLLLGFCLLGTIALVLWPMVLAPLQKACVAANVVSEARCTTGPNKLLAYIAMIAAFPAVLMLERLLPATRSQPLFSRGLMVDFIWFCAAPLILLLVIIPVEDALRWIYSDLLGLGRLSVIGSLPLPLQIVVVVLLADFLGWLAHYIRHKWIFWEFHKIHHSQEELNYFSTTRIHPLDGVMVMAVRFLPFAMLDASIAVPAFVVVQSFIRVYEMYTHSNVRTNMGPLRYILVTPQSHRVHHSMEREHIDKNFGNFLSIWDFMFGTQVRDFDVYPATGVHDKAVPRPVNATPAQAIVAWGAMLVYPFKVLFQKH